MRDSVGRSTLNSWRIGLWVAVQLSVVLVGQFFGRGRFRGFEVVFSVTDPCIK